MIRSEHVLLESQFPQPRAKPPAWALYYALAGLALGGCVALLGSVAAARGRAFRIVLGASYLTLGMPLGVLGCAIGYLTFFSAHSAAASNYNVLLLPPWVLALSVAGVGVMRGKARAFRVAHWTASSALGTSVLALVIHALTRNAQGNLQELWAALPLWAGVVLSVRLASSSRRPWFPGGGARRKSNRTGATSTSAFVANS